MQRGGADILQPGHLISARPARMRRLVGGASQRYKRKGRLVSKKVSDQLELFEPAADVMEPSVREILEQLRALNPQGMTPLDALATLDRLVNKSRGA